MCSRKWRGTETTILLWARLGGRLASFLRKRRLRVRKILGRSRGSKNRFRSWGGVCRLFCRVSCRSQFQLVRRDQCIEYWSQFSRGERLAHPRSRVQLTRVKGGFQKFLLEASLIALKIDPKSSLSHLVTKKANSTRNLARVARVIQVPWPLIVLVRVSDHCLSKLQSLRIVNPGFLNKDKDPKGKINPKWIREKSSKS